MPPTDKPRKSSARPANRDTSPPPAATRSAPRKKQANRGRKGRTRKGKDGTQTLPAPARAIKPAKPGSAAPETGPRALRDIPGLGPIRIRALEKAGLSSLRALRERHAGTTAGRAAA